MRPIGVTVTPGCESALKRVRDLLESLEDTAEGCPRHLTEADRPSAEQEDGGPCWRRGAFSMKILVSL